MSRTRMINHETSSDDDTDDSQSDTNSISNNNNIKFLTPNKYRIPQRTELSKVFNYPTPSNQESYSSNNDDDTSVSSTHGRTNARSYNGNMNHQSKQKPHDYLDNHHEDNTKLLYKRYPIIVGDFILTKKSTEDTSIYNYKPKHTQTSFLYRGAVNSTDVQERARNEMKQYVQQRSRTASSSPIYKKISSRNTPPLSTNLDNRNQFIRHDYEHKPTNDDLMINNSRDSTHESLHRQTHSTSSLHQPSSSSSYDNKRAHYIPNSHNTSRDQSTRYYFGQGSVNDPLDEQDSSSEDEKCVTFGRELQPKPRINTPRVNHSNFIPSINNNEDYFSDIILEQVTDVGTSTDYSLPKQQQQQIDTTLHERNSDSPEISPTTNQLAHRESETYHVNNETTNQDPYEEPDTIPFPIVKYPPSISTSTSSVVHPYLNRGEPNNQKGNIVHVNQPPKRYEVQEKEQENFYINEDSKESHRSSSQSSPTIQEIHRTNPLGGLSRSEYSNLNTNREFDPSISTRSNRSDRSHRSFFNLFRKKKKETAPKKDKSNKKKDEKIKRKN